MTTRKGYSNEGHKPAKGIDSFPSAGETPPARCGHLRSTARGVPPPRSDVRAALGACCSSRGATALALSMIRERGGMHRSAASTGLGGTDVLTAADPQLLFGIWLWTSVCLPLVVAFSRELDNPFWIDASAVIVCQPQLGPSLRKGWLRMIGTVVGSTVMVVLTASFPQDRTAYLALMALWRGLCVSSPRRYATLRLARRHSPAIRLQSSPPITSAQRMGRASRSICGRSRPAKSSANAQWCGILRRDGKALFGQFAEATAAARRAAQTHCLVPAHWPRGRDQEAPRARQSERRGVDRGRRLLSIAAEAYASHLDCGALMKLLPTS